MKIQFYRSTIWWQNLVFGIFLGFATICCLFGSRCYMLEKKHRNGVNMFLTKELNILKTMDIMVAQEYLQNEVKRRIRAFKFMRASSPQIFLVFSVNDGVVETIEKEFINDF